MANHEVKFSIPSRNEVLNEDITFEVRENGDILGKLRISKGTLDWTPKNKKNAKPHVITCKKFAEFAADRTRKTRKSLGR